MTEKEKVPPEEIAKAFVRNRQAHIKKNKPDQNGTSSLLYYLHKQRRETKTH